MKKIRSPFRTIPKAPVAKALPANIAAALRQQSEQINALTNARQAFINGAMAALGIEHANIDLETMTYTVAPAPSGQPGTQKEGDADGTEANNESAG